MKLSDVMSGANLALYAEVALILFLVVFTGVAIRVFLEKADPRVARLPLDEDAKEEE